MADKKQHPDHPHHPPHPADPKTGQTTGQGPAHPGGHGHGPTKTGTAGPAIDIDKALAQQPQWIQEEIKQLRKHEATVLRALQDTANQELFIKDPAQLLRKLGVPVSGPLRQRLQLDRSGEALKKAFCFSLPNGTTLKPRIRINFTK
jgi:hypothetical protein